MSVNVGVYSFDAVGFLAEGVGVCGIAGLIQTSCEQRRHEKVAAMVRHLVHRGPDDLGVAHDDFCAMGHSRLAIMDPANGRQPFGDPSGRYWLIYNGEVYNYRALRQELKRYRNDFYSDCDTEVVLKSLIIWGKEALTRFNGGFALAFYDRLERRLFLARDRYGKRPLFYAQHRGGLAFSSEVKAFLALPDFRFVLNDVGLAEVFYGGALISGDTVFQGVHELQPGMTLEWRDGGFSSQRFTRLTIGESSYSGTYTEARDELRQRLRQATLLQHRSDQALGVLLSGGLDSSIVVAEAMTEPGGSDRAFSLAFGETAFDESSMQQLVAEHFGLRHESLCVDAQAIAEALPQAVWHAETPFNCTAPVPMLLLAQKVKREGVSVVLTGEGADEAFLGYDLFKEVRLRSAPDADALQHLFSLYRKWGATDMVQVQRSVQRSDKPDHPLFSHLIRFNNSRLSCRLLRQSLAPNEYLDRWQQSQPSLVGLPPMQRARQIEYRLLLAGYLLSSQGDRMFAAHGVENRSPFLDNDVVDFALSLPDDWCLSDQLEEKHILRDAYRAQLPDAIVARRKQSYLAPAMDFIKTKNGESLIRECLGAERCADYGWLDADYAARVIERCQQTPLTQLTSGDSQSLLLMLTTSLLQRQFIDGDHPPTHCHIDVPMRDMTAVNA